jgi:hypothetical protein
VILLKQCFFILEIILFKSALNKHYGTKEVYYFNLKTNHGTAGLIEGQAGDIGLIEGDGIRPAQNSDNGGDDCTDEGVAEQASGIGGVAVACTPANPIMLDTFFVGSALDQFQGG